MDELQVKVRCLHAGDEKYAGQWLAAFQRKEEAWEICSKALSTGPEDKCCDEELLHAFCAQTLARLSRGFSSLHSFASQGAIRSDLEWLLTLHARGQKLVWKQLALALVSADLWLGRWNGSLFLSDASCPDALKQELLVLPTELLFSSRPLPLDSVHLRQQAAAGMLEACASVFPFLLNHKSTSSNEFNISKVLAAWLRAARKSLQWMTADESLPLRCLESCKESLLFQIRVASVDAETQDVGLQLAKWKGADDELSELLDPVLEILFADSSESFEETPCVSQLPLLQGLAADCWPRAVLGDFKLNWQLVTKKARSCLAISTACGEDASDGEAHAALGVWQTFAETLTEGVREPPVLMLASAQPGAAAPPEKRNRVGSPWLPTPSQISQCVHLPQIFAAFAEQLLESLRAPVSPCQEAFALLFEIRESAEAAIECWVKVMTDTPAWQEACWMPLHRLSQSLAASGGGEWLSEEVWREAEVALWFSTAVATKWKADSVKSAIKAVFELSTVLDNAPDPWRALLRCSTCGLASKSGSEPVTELVAWILQRSPFEADCSELIEFIELPYACAVESACQQLPSGVVHADIAEKLIGLALLDRAADTMHSDTTKARSFLLRALGHAMRGDPSLLCAGLSAPPALPKLRAAAEAEAAASEGTEWHALQALFSTLIAALPQNPVGPTPDGSMHPAETLWREHWQCFHTAIVQLAPCSFSDQPLKASCEALTAVACLIPNLMPDAVTLLVQSACRDETPTSQLEALQNIIRRAPCPPADPMVCSDMLAAAVVSVADPLLINSPSLMANPETMTAFIGLLLQGVTATSDTGPCSGALRHKLLANTELTRTVIMLLSESLPETNLPSVSSVMLQLLFQLLSGQGVDVSPHKDVMFETTIVICTSLVKALVAQEHLAERESLVRVGEVLVALHELCPTEAEETLRFGVEEAKVPQWSREPFCRHIKSCHEWPRKRDWLDYLLELVQEWQSEHRQKLI
jgi:hypothetical protein